jgi:predicted nucleotidyltransferase
VLRVRHSFLEILRALNAARARYLVIGGVAVALHGARRVARDLDLYPALDPDNLLRTIGALVNLGFRPVLPVPVDAILEPETRWQWVRKRHLRAFTLMDPRDPLHPVDLMIVQHVPFEEAWNRRLRLRVHGVAIPVVSMGDLLHMKRIAGRERDESDILRLRAVSRAKAN